jgi:thiol-disulfide isomerase/thioredoxin
VKNYELEMSHDEGVWSVISSTIKHTLVRKKNLDAKIGYRFRVRFEAINGTWSNFSHASDQFYVLPANFKLMSPPTLASAEPNSLTVQWSEVLGAEGYRLRYRKDDEIEWHVIETELKGNIAKKKGLAHGSYFFAVHPLGGAVENYTFSVAGGPFTTQMLNKFFTDMLPPHLIKMEHGKPKVVEMGEALAGKTVALYFSAHWCPPCRQFTPKLAELYRQLKAQNNNKFEVIFVSCDHTEDEFLSYFGEMPWYAVPYGDHQREAICGQFRVSGIPRLTVLNSSGRIIEENAVQHGISPQHIEAWSKA